MYCVISTIRHMHIGLSIIIDKLIVVILRLKLFQIVVFDQTKTCLQEIMLSKLSTLLIIVNA